MRVQEQTLSRAKSTITDEGVLIHLSGLMKYRQALQSLFRNNDQLAVQYTAHYITKYINK